MRVVHFFLYGTLLADSGTEMGRWIGERLVSAIPAAVPGRLFALPDPLGWYPALLPGCGRVRGMVARLCLAPDDLARLDRYERHEYRRRTVRARTPGGKGVAAQAWCWRLRLPPRAALIPDGDFVRWLARTGNRQFGVRRGGGPGGFALAKAGDLH